jgi:hypothetical protein
MGQYWKIVNLDKRQELRNHDFPKLVEILWNEVSEGLVDLLQVPQIRPQMFSQDAIQRAKNKWYARLSTIEEID